MWQEEWMVLSVGKLLVWQMEIVGFAADNIKVNKISNSKKNSNMKILKLEFSILS